MPDDPISSTKRPGTARSSRADDTLPRRADGPCESIQPVHRAFARSSYKVLHRALRRMEDCWTSRGPVVYGGDPLGRL